MQNPASASEQCLARERPSYRDKERHTLDLYQSASTGIPWSPGDLVTSSNQDRSAKNRSSLTWVWSTLISLITPSYNTLSTTILSTHHKRPVTGQIGVVELQGSHMLQPPLVTEVTRWTNHRKQSSREDMFVTFVIEVSLYPREAEPQIWEMREFSKFSEIFSETRSVIVSTLGSREVVFIGKHGENPKLV